MVGYYFNVGLAVFFCAAHLTDDAVCCFIKIGDTVMVQGFVVAGVTFQFFLVIREKSDLIVVQKFPCVAAHVSQILENITSAKCTKFSFKLAFFL